MIDLKAFRKDNNLTQSAVGAYLGVGKSFISRVENGNVALPEDKLSKLISNDRGWFTDKLTKEVKTSPTPSSRSSDDAKAYLPLIPVEAVAGFPVSDNEGISLQDCETYRVPDFIQKGAQFLIRVSGSSMYPKYSNGDILACRRIESVTFFQWGKVYVLDTCQGALVKRIFEDKDSTESVICRSDNTAHYPDFRLPVSEIRTLSIVIGVIRLE